MRKLNMRTSLVFFLNAFHLFNYVQLLQTAAERTVYAVELSLRRIQRLLKNHEGSACQCNGEDFKTIIDLKVAAPTQ